jgi:hypothetical protein
MADEDLHVEVAGIRPMPIPGKPETFHGGTAAESMREQSGHRPMPKPKGPPRPPLRVTHES